MYIKLKITQIKGNESILKCFIIIHKRQQKKRRKFKLLIILGIKNIFMVTYCYFKAKISC